MDALTIMTGVGIFIPMVYGVYMGLTSRAIAAEKETVNRRLEGLEKRAEKAEELKERLQANDLLTVRMEGRLAMEEQKHATVVRDVEEVKDKMVTRDMWEATNKKLDQILATRGFGSGGYSRTAISPTPTPPKMR